MAVLYSNNMNNYSDYIFTDEEKKMIRPIAETLALIDGNAFFSLKFDDKREWYEMYLPEAMEIFISNGGLNGLANQVSWLKNIS